MSRPEDIKNIPPIVFVRGDIAVLSDDGQWYSVSSRVVIPEKEMREHGIMLIPSLDPTPDDVRDAESAFHDFRSDRWA